MRLLWRQHTPLQQANIKVTPMAKKAQKHRTPKADWSTMTHREHVEALSRYTVEQLANDYYIDGFSDTDFSRHLAAQVELWDVHNVKELQSAGGPPTKDIVLGAWRDLDRSEALLELIDNSIDAWLSRMENYPRKTAPELDIYIDVDSDSGRLVYEDNAGGIPVEKLTNLVIPGHSDTTERTRTIGSFKCGLTRKLPSKKEGSQIGAWMSTATRLVEKFLKTEFGFWYACGLATGTKGHDLFRGELIIWHSFAIPWDTTNAEYMHDHPVCL